MQSWSSFPEYVLGTPAGSNNFCTSMVPANLMFTNHASKQWRVDMLEILCICIVDATGQVQPCSLACASITYTYADFSLSFFYCQHECPGKGGASDNAEVLGFGVKECAT